jgi:uncharacterized protein YceH (UPF0502 family)
MAEFPDPGVVESVLAGLANRPGGPLVTQLAREPNRRDARWAQLFEELPASVTAATAEEIAANAAGAGGGAAPRGPTNAELIARVATLESEITALRAEIASLKQGRSA